LCAIFNSGEASNSIPHFKGIITSGVLLRDNSLEAIQLCNEWWKELTEGSARDQVAFAKISIGKKFKVINWNYTTSNELIYYKHFKNRKENDKAPHGVVKLSD